MRLQAALAICADTVHAPVMAAETPLVEVGHAAPALKLPAADGTSRSLAAADGADSTGLLPRSLVTILSFAARRAAGESRGVPVKRCGDLGRSVPILRTNWHSTRPRRGSSSPCFLTVTRARSKRGESSTRKIRPFRTRQRSSLISRAWCAYLRQDIDYKQRPSVSEILESIDGTFD